ncbi:MAG: DUF6588 family protein [Balneolales bacterium]
MITSKYRTSLRYAATLVFAFALSLGLSSSSHAQFGDIGAMIKAGDADASILVKEYLRPFGEGVGAVTNTGWVNRAKPHRKLGFDVQIRASAAMVPDQSRNFDVSTLGLSDVTRPISSGNKFTPTISGKRNTGAGFEIYGKDGSGNEHKLGEFNMPKGTGFPYIPAPMINASVGVVFDTDVMVRFIPETSLYGDMGSINLLGAGLKHGINQYIPGGWLLPVDLSVMGAFTQFNMEADPKVRINQNDEFDQQLAFSANSFNVNALVGKNLPFISFFAGLGFETSSTSFEANGDYPILEVNAGGQQEQAILTDPVNIAYESSTNFRAMAGARFSLLIFDLFADVTYSDYVVGSAGVGISFR